ncbi:MAG: c-type cytochrome [Candidatus Eisenbacteria bacterium]
MQPIGVKIALAFLLTAAGLTAAGSMLALLGRTETTMQPGTLKRIHRTAGYVFGLSLVVLAVLGARIVATSGDGLPLRGVVHWVLGTLLVIVAILKIALVRHYKKFLKFAPGVGLLTLVLALLVAAVSAGFVIVTGGTGGAASVGEADAAALRVEGVPVAAASPADVAAGEGVFRSNCAVCHVVESDVPTAGLRGFFERDSLKSSGLPVTVENVRAQIVDPVGRMPSFASRLSGDELLSVLSYLQTL